MPSYKYVEGLGVIPSEEADRYRHAETRRSAFPCPVVRSDIQEYHSPIDGKLITSRSQRREDLKANDCIEWEPGMRQDLKSGRRNLGEGPARQPGWSRKHQRPIKNGLLV